MPTIFEIAAELNQRANSHAIGGLQALRQKLKGLSRLPTNKLFDGRTTFDKYAFHVGGRTELQFNIGSELLDEGDYIRYGVAFSLEPSQTLPDIEKLRPLVMRFNEFLRQHPDEYGNLRMWHYANGARSTTSPPVSIPPERFKPHTFIFLGGLQSAKNVDCDVIIKTFDRLLPLYHYVHGSESYPALAETKDGFVFKPGCSLKRSAATASKTAADLDIYLRHNDLQFALYRHLCAKYGANAVSTEQGNGKGARIDVVVRVASSYRFYEIKIASSARGCIREALAQLLEYSFWPSAQEAEQLIIVGEPALDNDSETFLAMFRSRFKLPIYYEQFELGNNVE